MEVTVSNLENIQLGHIVAQDVFANTKSPIITQNTVIRPVHLLILEAFQVKDILIKEPEVSAKTDEDANSSIPKAPPMTKKERYANIFERNYNHAIQQIKKEFFNWEAGAHIDITKVRGFFLPLLDNALQDRTVIYDLNGYGVPEDYIYHHCIATGLIAAVITQKLGYERGIIIQMGLAGLLADCGMAKVERRIRNKASALSESEFKEVQRHPYHSLNMIKMIPVLKDAMKLAIYQHHERLDGSGYPAGNKTDSISKFAQIIAVADVFHAMTSERLYRARTSTFKVVEMIRESEFGKFDMEVVQALINVVADLPLNTEVELSNLEKAEVMFINQYALTRPLVKVLSTGELLDLSQHRTIYINRVLK